MKIKEFFFLLGLKPGAKRYGVELRRVAIPGEGEIDVAQWLAPKALQMRPTKEQVDRLRLFLRPGDVAIDIGAHMGDTALPMALAVGATGAVLALEPNPFIYPVLEWNAALNRDRTRIMPLRFAAMREDGEYEFHYGSRDFDNGGFHEGMSRWMHGSAFTVRVPGHNTSDYLRRHHADLLPRLRFIKVDAEGFDLAVVQTLVPLIEAHRPFLQVEVFSRKRSLPGYREELIAFLQGLGYELRRADAGSPFEGTLVTKANLDQWTAYDVFCIPTRGGAPRG